MTALLPSRFLIRVAQPCPHWAKMPLSKGERILDLPDAAKVNNFAELDGLKNYADVRLAWNDFGLGVQVTVKGKEQEPVCDSERPRSGDGFTLWIDTRDARASHRASRYCHQFHFLPGGGGRDKEEPWFGQSKINRAQQDAPLCRASEVPFRGERLKEGYRLEAFLPASVLAGYDPEQHPRLGFYYAVRDAEHGEEFLSVNADFPYWDDPSLWSVLELEK
jgi:hypothetical protein